MNILSFFDFPGAHDTSAAVVCDGVLVAAAEEERFTRIKHGAGAPLHAIDFCLREAGLSMGEVDLIAVPDLPFRTGAGSAILDVDDETLRRLRDAGYATRRSIAHRFGLRTLDSAGLLRWSWLPSAHARNLFATVRERFGPLPPLRCFDHHRSHAAASFFTSGLEEAAVCTVDGRGDIYSAVTWHAEDGRIERVRSEPWFNSLGRFYSDITRFLDLGEFGEGKTMGLAAYGDPKNLCGELARCLRITDTPRWYEYIKPPSEALIGVPQRVDTDALAAPYPDLAAAAQHALEEALARMISSTLDGATRNVCLGGGVALNCAANGKLAKRSDVDGFWTFAASGDSGLPVGAALLAASEAGELIPSRLESVALGPAFSESEIVAALKADSRITWRKSRSVEAETAALLADDQVIGWFQNRMELGPRALGGRSLLANPASTNTRDRVNRLKGREPWRPLAPAILAERAKDYLAIEGDSPFMLRAVPVTDRARRRSPAIVHVDDTARPQTVRPSGDTRLHALLTHFEDLTGLPLVLNTSFNRAGEPIVCTPAEAIESFLGMGLDALVCNDFVVRST